MSLEDRRAVEEAARRIVEYERWRKKNGQGGRGFPSPALEVLEEATGGFTDRTVKLAKRALARARQLREEDPRREPPSASRPADRAALPAYESCPDGSWRPV